ncbi:uncharacterized protein LOC133959058 isoform X2 [Platichthys flesus]|uniref:uncharacterized protein LOC133959058 isoform X2 n=1 Tax=Platichthys flesus TaxID=8260 RepID=UPI002DBCFD5A|nr:uncharacterized protein LOC133959058 isoform X2 [Platichthys flesus]
MEDPMEEIFTISLKPLLFPESFTNTFCGRPLSLQHDFNIRKDSDDNELILTILRDGQTSEGHHQDDAERTTLIIKFNLICKKFGNMHPERFANVCIGSEKLEFLKNTNSDISNILSKYSGKKSQHMIGMFFAEGYKKIIFFSVPKPNYSENCQDLNEHTEEIIIRLINDYLSKHFYNKKPKGIIVLYSTNSPCIKRENDTKVACMFQLLVIAKHWKIKYGIDTKLYFKKCWGPIKRNCSEVIRSIPDRFAKQQIQFSIQLSHKKLKKLSIKDLFSMVPDKTDRNTILNEFKNIKKGLNILVKEKKSLTYHEHIDKVKTLIAECTCNPKLNDMVLDILQEKVKSQEKEGISENETKILNSVLVKSFIDKLELILGESSPIKFYQIPLMDLSSSSEDRQI